MGPWRGPLLIGLLGAAISSTNCTLAPAQVETRKETLSKIPLELRPGKTHPAVLLVLPPEASAVYDTTQMAYELRPYEIAYFSQTEWADRPTQMLYRLLVRTLEQAGCFSAVVTPPFMGRYTYVLRTELLVLRQDFTVEPPALQLDLRIQLIAEPSHQVVATKEIGVREPMRAKTPYAGAAAANEATAKVLKELAEFVQLQMG